MRGAGVIADDAGRAFRQRHDLGDAGLAVEVDDAFAPLLSNGGAVFHLVRPADDGDLSYACFAQPASQRGVALDAPALEPAGLLRAGPEQSKFAGNQVMLRHQSADPVPALRGDMQMAMTGDPRHAGRFQGQI